MKQQQTRYYPILLKVENQDCLVVGGGQVGARKVKTLLGAGARVGVVSPEVVPWLAEKIREGTVDWVGSDYEEHQLRQSLLVIAATDDINLNCRIAMDAGKRGILCNVVDYPREGNFILPSLVQRGALTIAISTSGQSPALARKLRQDLEQLFGFEYAEFLELMGAIRRRLLKEGRDSRANKERFDRLIRSTLLDLVRRRDYEGIDHLLLDILGPGYSLQNLEVSW